MTSTQFYIYRFFCHWVPVYPVYLILFSEKGLSLSEISLLLMIWSVPLILLEIPSGILADIWSRKNLVLIGTALHAACFAVWIFADGFLLFAIGFVLWGISEAMISGALEALLFDSLKEKGMEDRFDTVYSRGETIARISIAIAMISGGFITQYLGYGVVICVSVGSLSIAVLCLLPVREVNSNRTDRKDEESFAVHGGSVFKKSLVFLFRSKMILLPVLLSILVFGMYGIIDEYDQEVASHYMPGILWIALWGTARFIAEAAGSFLAPFLKRLMQKKDSPVVPIIAVCVFAASSLLLFSIFRSPFTVAFYGLYFMAMASMNVLIEDYIQQKIEDAGRSTVHSIVSLLMNLYAVILFSVFSGIFAVADIYVVLLAAAVYVIIVSIVIGFLMRKPMPEKPRK